MAKLGSYCIFVLLVFHLSFIDITTTSTCETPTEWLEQAAKDSATNNKDEFVEFKTVNNNLDYTDGEVDLFAFSRNPNFRTGRRWLNATVPYKIDHELTSADKAEVVKAFKEYHRKTCIRFRKWKERDENYVSIEINETTCGLASVCMKGGYQYAQFGRDCKNMATMVHELGHTLCLQHEHTRLDRDEYVTYPENCSEEDKNSTAKIGYFPIEGIYDYYSQMHYACDNSCKSGGIPKRENEVNLCGDQITSGLSLLDADHLNEIYNCGGCFRHRWKPIKHLNKQDKRFMYSFGYADIRGTPLFPCRTFYKGEIAIGKFDIGRKICIFSWGGREFAAENSEVLTIPGGLEVESFDVDDGVKRTYSYELVNIRSIDLDTLVKIGVPAGQLPDCKGGEDGIGVGYIAFGQISFEAKDGLSEDVIGKVWVRKDEEFPVAHFPRLAQEHVHENFKVLVCKEITE